MHCKKTLRDLHTNVLSHPQCAIIMGVLNTPSISFACCPHQKFGLLPFGTPQPTAHHVPIFFFSRSYHTYQVEKDSIYCSTLARTCRAHRISRVGNGHGYASLTQML